MNKDGKKRRVLRHVCSTRALNCHLEPSGREAAEQHSLLLVALLVLLKHTALFLEYVNLSSILISTQRWFRYLTQALKTQVLYCFL